jgi:hypothetical protein
MLSLVPVKKLSTQMTSWPSARRRSQRWLRGELLDLGLEGFVFGAFALQEARGDAGLGLDALGGEQVGVGELVVALAEVLDLHPALVDDGAHAEVGAAQADAERLRQIALGGVGVRLQVLEDTVVKLVGHGGVTRTRQS